MPPWAETLADPVLSPKQTTESKLATAVKPNKGSSTNIDKEDWQLLESVTFTLYVPVLRLSKKETLPVPIPQSLTYGVIPPVTFIPIKPSLPPLQETSEKELILITKGSGTVIFCDKETKQLLSSVTSRVYTPAVILPEFEGFISWLLELKDPGPVQL